MILVEEQAYLIAILTTTIMATEVINPNPFQNPVLLAIEEAQEPLAAMPVDLQAFATLLVVLVAKDFQHYHLYFYLLIQANLLKHHTPSQILIFKF